MNTDRHSFQSLTYSLWGIFALTILSGAFLLVYYLPTFSQAFASVEKLNGQVPFGWMIRRLHGAGGNFLFLLLAIHLLRVFYAGVYKNRPGRFWILEVLLVGFALWVNFTGYFLPLSQEAFWGTAVSLSGFSTLPWIGGCLVEFLRGGKELGGVALSRFFSMHVLFAVLLGLLVFGHSRRERQGQTEVDEKLCAGNWWVSAFVAALLLAVITFIPHWFVDPLREAANPTSNPAGIVGPWYLMFFQEGLLFFSSASRIWSLILIAALFFLIFFLPYFDRTTERSLLLRPFCLVVGSGLLALVLYFTFLGMAGAHYGEKVVLPVRPVSAMEIRGAIVYAEKNCAYCHQVFGKEGRREGPDMAVISKRHRSPEWVRRFISNARLYQPGTTMPKYELPLEDLESLQAYLMALDSTTRKFQIVERSLLFELGPIGALGGGKQ
jgi:quinol-cytochrome oxidoreductase complex cytochrome b subunit